MENTYEWVSNNGLAPLTEGSELNVFIETFEGR